MNNTVTVTLTDVIKDNLQGEITEAEAREHPQKNVI